MRERLSHGYAKVGVDFLMRLARLSTAEQVVFAYLVKMSGYSGTARITQKEMAGALDMGLRTIEKACAKLKKAGIIAVGGHARIHLNPDLVARGSDSEHMFKVIRFREAKGVELSAQEAAETKAYLETNVALGDESTEREQVAAFDAVCGNDIDLGF